MASCKATGGVSFFPKNEQFYFFASFSLFSWFQLQKSSTMTSFLFCPPLIMTSVQLLTFYQSAIKHVKGGLTSLIFRNDGQICVKQNYALHASPHIFINFSAKTRVFCEQGQPRSQSKIIPHGRWKHQYP